MGWWGEELQEVNWLAPPPIEVGVCSGAGPAWRWGCGPIGPIGVLRAPQGWGRPGGRAAKGWLASPPPIGLGGMIRVGAGQGERLQLVRMGWANKGQGWQGKGPREVGRTAPSPNWAALLATVGLIATSCYSVMITGFICMYVYIYRRT